MRKAFTLIELVAVLAIVALLTAGVSLSLRGALRDAHAEDAASRLVAFDALARQEARRLNRPSELHIDPHDGRVWRREVSASGGDHETGVALVLPPGVAIDEVFTARGRSRATETITIACSASGRTASYAILLSGPGERRRWIMFAGLTGQSRLIEHDRNVQDIFGVLSRP